MYSINDNISKNFAPFPPISVSFYFASEDRVFFEILDRYLTPLKRNGHIQTWDDQQILAGQEGYKTREYHLSTDRLLILLISPDFLASEACHHQMDIALRRYRNEEVTVIPVLVRPCLWEQTELKVLQLLPRSQNALGVHPFPESIWQEVATEINKVVDFIQQQRTFIAYATKDGDFADRLHRDLVISGVQIWSPERKQLDTNLSQDNEIRNAMRNASMVLLIVSSSTASSYVAKTQMALAADYHRPILLIWSEGEDEEQPSPDDWHADMVIDARAERYEKAITTLMKLLKLQGKVVFSSREELLLSKEPRNPYKGLQAFTAEDVRDFFGREALIGKIAAALEQIVTQEKTKGKQHVRLLTILGASGSGKSSVVRAGLLPYLQQKGISDSREWIYLTPIMPGAHPLEALAVSLSQYASLGNAISLRRDLTSDSSRVLHLLASQLVGSSRRKVVLLIDQFEEVFTLTSSEEERQRFFNLLETAVTEPQGPLLLLLTLRADFYDRPMQYPKLYHIMEAHRFSILSMDREDLRRVIEGPAQLPDVQIAFEGDLVGDLLFEVREQSTPLPLLQFTLDQLFARREGRQLTLQAYHDIGGVKGALVKHAEETYANLPSEEHQKLAQILFGRLIDPGTTQQETTRYRAALSEFLLPDPKLTLLLREAMDAFIAARLLMTNEIAGTTTIEVTHEALIREWPRCALWIREAHENLLFRQTLRQDVAQWEQLGKPQERLYHGSQLRTAKKKIDYRYLNQHEARFLYKSTTHQRQQWIRMVAMFLLPVIVLGLVLTPLFYFRPSWCPSWLCSQPQPLIARGGVYDSNFQVTLQTLQSSIKVLPGDPSSYTLGNLPATNDAQLIAANQSLPYRIVLKIHSLQQGRYGLSIEQVSIVVDREAPVIPYPLHVWISDNVPTFDHNLYRVTYRRQKANTVLPALYIAQPFGLVQLSPGDSDELSLEVRSSFVVDLHFQVQVTYQVIGDSISHILTLPNIFEVVFSDSSNWYPYILQDGHLILS